MLQAGYTVEADKPAVVAAAVELLQLFAPEEDLMSTGNRTCQCGAVYRRTELLAPAREIESFECVLCGASMESWNTAWVPRYRLLVGPVIRTDGD